jgi:hypothetical protein
MPDKPEKLVAKLKEILWRLRQDGEYSDDILDLIDAYDYLGIETFAKPNTIKSFERKAQTAIDQYNDNTLETKRIIGLSYVRKPRKKRMTKAKSKRKPIKKSK